MNSFNVRLASLSDLPAISAIEDTSFPAPYPPFLLERLLKECSNSFFVATNHSRELVGYCVCSLGEKSAHLISVAVRTDFRRKGAATSLLQRTLRFLKTHDVEEFWLEVNPKNAEAIALYIKLGFERAGLMKRYYQDGSDAISMRLALRATNSKRIEGGGNR